MARGAVLGGWAWAGEEDPIQQARPARRELGRATHKEWPAIVPVALRGVTVEGGWRETRWGAVWGCGGVSEVLVCGLLRGTTKGMDEGREG